MNHKLKQTDLDSGFVMFRDTCPNNFGFNSQKIVQVERNLTFYLLRQRFCYYKSVLWHCNGIVYKGAVRKLRNRNREGVALALC